jgi:hypothetical protein
MRVPPFMTKPDVAASFDPGPDPDDVEGTAPSDHTTVVEVIDGYRSSGFVGDFYAEPQSVRCGQCQSVLDPARLMMHSMRRLEGASDPSDMQVVVATSCPACGAQGTMVLGYGPMASEEDAMVLSTLQDRRDDDVLPGDSPVTEAPTGTS